MKKYLLVFVTLVFTLGCNLSDSELESNPKIRYQNSTSDFAFYYGLKFGDAEFLFTPSDPFMPNDTTEYITTEEGGYSIQAKDSNGNWLTFSVENTTVSKGGEYTIVISGSYTDSTLDANIITDTMP